MRAASGGVRLFAAQRLPWLNTLSAIYRIRRGLGEVEHLLRRRRPFWSVQEFRVSVEPDWTRGVIPFLVGVRERLGKKIPLAWVVVLVGAPLPGLIWKRLPTVRLMA